MSADQIADVFCTALGATLGAAIIAAAIIFPIFRKAHK